MIVSIECKKQNKKQYGQEDYKHQYWKVNTSLKVDMNCTFRKDIVSGAVRRCKSFSIRPTLQEPKPGTAVTLAQHKGVGKPDKALSVARHLSRFAPSVSHEYRWGKKTNNKSTEDTKSHTHC